MTAKPALKDQVHKLQYYCNIPIIMQNKNQNKFNFIFWGTPRVASETLEILKIHGYLPSIIITAPDKPAGRGMVMTPPPAKDFAVLNNIPYLQPEKLDTAFLDLLKIQLGTPTTKSIDLSIVVAYGKIMPEEFLNFPKLGSINIHYSLLPKYRGASPVESAILNGDTETGVSIQQMEYKMDAGPILAEEKTYIGETEKAEELKNRLIKIGGELLVKVLPDIFENKIQSKSQDESQATFCKKINKEEGSINLEDDPVKNYNKFRAYAKSPRTYFFKDSKRYIITDAVLENGKFIIKKVIPEGKKEMGYKN